jgi:hypothetical protein
MSDIFDYVTIRENLDGSISIVPKTAVEMVNDLQSRSEYVQAHAAEAEERQRQSRQEMLSLKGKSPDETAEEIAIRERMFAADPAARAAYERGQQAERERLEAIQQKALESLRTFGEFRDEGLLWLINTSVFHPRGFAIAFVYDDDDTEFKNPTGWRLVGDGSEPWWYNEGEDVDEIFNKATAFFNRATQPKKEKAEDGKDS